MKFTCSQSSLSKAVNMVSRAVSAKTTVNALKGILLTVTGKQLILTASDMDFSVVTKIDIVEAEEGSIIVSAKLFSDIIRKLPNSMIRAFSDEKNRFIIHCHDSEFNIVGAASEEYPSVASVDNNDSFLLNSKEFCKLVERTSFASSIDEKKGVLVGCLLNMEEEFTEMVALDGFRMAISKTSAKTGMKKSVIIPSKILSEICKLLSEQEFCENVNVTIGDTRIRFVAGDITMVSRLLEGEFIRYRDILPRMYRTRIIVERDALLSSVERASLFVSEGKNNLIKMKIDENGVQISSRNDTGHVNEVINGELEGDPLEIGFNSKYLIDVLKVVDDEELALEMTNSLSACMVKQVEGDSYSFLVLPVRLSV